VAQKMDGLMQLEKTQALNLFRFNAEGINVKRRQILYYIQKKSVTAIV